MMPFVFGDIDSLPPELQCYYDLIEQCPYRNSRSNETGKIGYLTVHESWVEAGSTQRRPGLHIEAPGTMNDNTCAMTPGIEHGWGMGVFWGPDQYEGGIYLASSVAGTSQVWDALVDKNVRNIVDEHGGCEHLRPLLGPGTKLAANQLILDDGLHTARGAAAAGGGSPAVLPRCHVPDHALVCAAFHAQSPCARAGGCGDCSRQQV